MLAGCGGKSVPLFYRVRDPDGSTRMVEQDLSALTPVPVIAPVSPTVAGVGMKRYSCTACTPPKPFASAGVMSMHFMKVHKNLWTDKNSWRKWVKEFGDS